MRYPILDLISIGNRFCSKNGKVSDQTDRVQRFLDLINMVILMASKNLKNHKKSYITELKLRCLEILCWI